MVFDPAPLPKTPLGRYRLLSPTAAVRVSPLCLGAMNFGEAWSGFMGACDKKTAFEIMDYFYESGGNFIDTSNNYQGEESEIWIGEWMAARKNRDQIVLATKYTSPYRLGHGDKEILTNTAGNGTKSLHVSLAASLKKLQTDYIDVLWMHWIDGVTSIQEVMQSLNVLVLAGKVLYLGVSDTPAWWVSKANQYARDHGLRQFSVYQGQWSAAERDFERDIIPMCVEDGMGLCPWGALGGGHFKSDEDRKSTEGRKLREASEQAIATSKVLERIAKKKDTAIASVALAYVMHKTPYVFPIVGGRKIEHLKGNIEALKLSLSQEDMDEIEDAVPFDIGFPQSFIGGKKGIVEPSDIWFMSIASHIDHVKNKKPITPAK